jgi:hypothetical protein
VGSERVSRKNLAVSGVLMNGGGETGGGTRDGIGMTEAKVRLGTVVLFCAASCRNKAFISPIPSWRAGEMTAMAAGGLMLAEL